MNSRSTKQYRSCAFYCNTRRVYDIVTQLKIVGGEKNPRRRERFVRTVRSAGKTRRADDKLAIWEKKLRPPPPTVDVVPCPPPTPEASLSTRMCGPRAFFTSPRRGRRRRSRRPIRERSPTRAPRRREHDDGGTRVAAGFARVVG